MNLYVSMTMMWCRLFVKTQHPRLKSRLIVRRRSPMVDLRLWRYIAFFSVIWQLSICQRKNGSAEVCLLWILMASWNGSHLNGQNSWEMKSWFTFKLFWFLLSLLIWNPCGTALLIVTRSGWQRSNVAITPRVEQLFSIRSVSEPSQPKSVCNCKWSGWATQKTNLL